MNENISLNMLPMGSKCRVEELLCHGTLRRRLLDLGIAPDTVIEVLQTSPSGDPVAYFIKGAIIALRCEVSSKILVRL